MIILLSIILVIGLLMALGVKIGVIEVAPRAKSVKPKRKFAPIGNSREAKREQARMMMDWWEQDFEVATGAFIFREALEAKTRQGPLSEAERNYETLSVVYNDKLAHWDGFPQHTEDIHRTYYPMVQRAKQELDKLKSMTPAIPDHLPQGDTFALTLQYNERMGLPKNAPLKEYRYGR